jgi:putative (di)nucleoside polyphosphate hydrolase
MLFLGEDSDVRLDLHEQEFSEWRWISKDELVDNIVPFKRETYAEVLLEFDGLTWES